MVIEVNEESHRLSNIPERLISQYLGLFVVHWGRLFCLEAIRSEPLQAKPEFEAWQLSLRQWLSRLNS